MSLPTESNPAEPRLDGLPKELLDTIFYDSLELNLCHVNRHLRHALPYYKQLRSGLSLLAFASDVVLPLIPEKNDPKIVLAIVSLKFHVPLLDNERRSLQRKIFRSGWFSMDDVEIMSERMYTRVLNHYFPVLPYDPTCDSCNLDRQGNGFNELWRTENPEARRKCLRDDAMKGPMLFDMNMLEIGTIDPQYQLSITPDSCSHKRLDGVADDTLLRIPCVDLRVVPEQRMFEHSPSKRSLASCDRLMRTPFEIFEFLTDRFRRHSYRSPDNYPPLLSLKVVPEELEWVQDAITRAIKKKNLFRLEFLRDMWVEHETGPPAETPFIQITAQHFIEATAYDNSDIMEKLWYPTNESPREQVFPFMHPAITAWLAKPIEYEDDEWFDRYVRYVRHRIATGRQDRDWNGWLSLGEALQPAPDG